MVAKIGRRMQTSAIACMGQLRLPADAGSAAWAGTTSGSVMKGEVGSGPRSGGGGVGGRCSVPSLSEPTARSKARIATFYRASTVAKASWAARSWSWATMRSRLVPRPAP